MCDILILIPLNIVPRGPIDNILIDLGSGLASMRLQAITWSNDGNGKSYSFVVAS